MYVLNHVHVYVRMCVFCVFCTYVFVCMCMCVNVLLCVLVCLWVHLYQMLLLIDQTLFPRTNVLRCLAIRLLCCP